MDVIIMKNNVADHGSLMFITTNNFIWIILFPNKQVQLTTSLSHSMKEVSETYRANTFSVN